MKTKKKTKKLSDEEFKEWAIRSVKRSIKKEKYPCEIGRVSKVYIGGCEWCDRTTRRIHIDLSANPGAPMFTKGHCNSGQCTIHEDPHFRSQSDWFVCGQCPNS